MIIRLLERLLQYLEKKRMNALVFSIYISVVLTIFSILISSIPIFSPIKDYFRSFLALYLGLFGTLIICLVFHNNKNSRKFIPEILLSIIFYSVSSYIAYNLITPDQTQWMFLHTITFKKIFVYLTMVSCSFISYYFSEFAKFSRRDLPKHLNWFYKYYPLISIVLVIIVFFIQIFILSDSETYVCVTSNFEVIERSILWIFTPLQLILLPDVIIMLYSFYTSYDKMDVEKFILFPCGALSGLAILADASGDTVSMFMNVLGVDTLLIYLYVNLNQNEYERSKILNDSLVAQMKPHFMFNLLNAIIDLNENGASSQEISKHLTDFAKYMRYFVDNTNTNETVIDFNRELQHVNYYFNLQKVRFPNIELKLDIDISDFKIPILTLQPLIENCVNHSGITRSEVKNGFIKIKTYRIKDYNIIEVIDNGKWQSNNKRDENSHKSTGMNNIKRRIRFDSINNKIDIQSPIDEDGGTKVTVSLYDPQD